MSSKTVFSIVVPAGDLATLRRVCRRHGAQLRALRARHQERLRRLDSAGRAAAALEFAAELADLAEAGQLLPTASAAIDWGVRGVLRGLGLAGPLPSPPAEAALAGKRWGVGTRVVGEAATLNVRLARPFHPVPGSTIPLGEQVVRAAWARSAAPIGELRAWEDRFGPGRDRPLAEDLRYRAALVRQVVTTGDLVRSALTAVCKARPAPPAGG